MPKDWKCRLAQHDWVDRENPETHVHYLVCRRCDAERGTRFPRWGTGAADDANRTNPGGLPYG